MFRAGTYIYRIEDIVDIDTSDLESLRVQVALKDQIEVDVSGPDAIDLLMQVKPSALEGRRLRWIRNQWAIHNLIGHPLMQILSWCGKPKWGIWVHEATIPTPKSSFQS